MRGRGRASAAIILCFQVLQIAGATRNAAEKQNVRLFGNNGIGNRSDSPVIELKPMLAVVWSAVRGIMAAVE